MSLSHDWAALLRLGLVRQSPSSRLRPKYVKAP